LADESEDGSGLHDREVAERVGVVRQTVENARRRCVLVGLDGVSRRRKRSRPRSRGLDGEVEAQLIAIARLEPPEGRARWTLHLLAEEVQRRGIVASGVARDGATGSKRTPSNPGNARCGAFRRSRGAPVRDGAGAGRVHAPARPGPSGSR